MSVKEALSHIEEAHARLLGREGCGEAAQHIACAAVALRPFEDPETLKDYARQIEALALDLSHRWHLGQEDRLVKIATEDVLDHLLRAKARLLKAHKHLNGEDPISGVA